MFQIEYNWLFFSLIVNLWVYNKPPKPHSPLEHEKGLRVLEEENKIDIETWGWLCKCWENHKLNRTTANRMESQCCDEERKLERCWWHREPSRRPQDVTGIKPRLPPVLLWCPQLARGLIDSTLLKQKCGLLNLSPSLLQLSMWETKLN